MLGTGDTATMLRGSFVVLIVATTSIVGCKDKASTECEAWIEKSLQCDKSAPTGKDRQLAIDMLNGMCRAAMRGKSASNAMAERINETVRARVKCAAVAECTEFAACEKRASNPGGPSLPP